MPRAFPGRSLLGFLLPVSCLSCGDRTAGRLPLCASCGSRLAPVARHDLARALSTLDGIEGLVTLWMLDREGPARDLVHGLKYGGLRRLGVELGHLLGGHVHGAFDAVLPVPLHRLRQVERGYNQSERIARGVAERLGIPVATDALARTRAAASQTRSGRDARRMAVHGAFEVARSDIVSGRGVLLVDDVLTTGATASAAADALVRAGARRVVLATVGLTRSPQGPPTGTGAGGRVIEP